MFNEFDQLVAKAQACRACPAMDGRLRILSQSNGPKDAKIMLVGEAPGRLGAERSGTPFVGDESGRRLDRLIEAAGWKRSSLFITNAILCNPQDEQGNNRPPKKLEIRNCSTWLEAQIEVVDPVLVVALGAVALRALDDLSAHDLTVQHAGTKPIRWNERWLAPVYHPGARAAIHRKTELQLEDFRRLGEWFSVMRDADFSVGNAARR